MENPHITKIRVYPVKSLDPVAVEEVQTSTFSLQYDRDFAMIATDKEQGE